MGDIGRKQPKKRKPRSKNIYITTTWTCARRKLDARRYADYFVKNNHTIVNDPRKADIIILVTCSDTNSRATEALKEVNRLMHYPAELIVTGCLPGIDKEKLAEIYHGKTVVTKEMEKIDELFPDHTIKLHDVPDADILWENVDESNPLVSLKKWAGKSQRISRASTFIRKTIRNSSIWDSPVFSWYGTSVENPFFIRVSTGCLGKCSYCAINKAIGVMHSKPLDELLAEFKKGLQEGYKNFIIDADDLGCYGVDIGTSLPEFINKILSIHGDYSVDLHFIHPHWVIKYIDELEKILQTGRITRMGSSIQSGNPRVMALMRRYSNIEKIKEAFFRLKKAYPPLVLETEVIVGFPTETFEEFLSTLHVIEEVRFNWGVIYPFSCKTGTEAENINPKIPREEILRRIAYAKKYLRKYKYTVRYAKYFRKLSQNILVFSNIDSMPNPIRKK
jgi:tRNA A37 methylthiotransferase MiaB